MLLLYRRQMGKQRVGVDSVAIFLVACEQEQAFAVQTRCQVFPAKLNNIVTFSLTLAGVQPFGQRRKRKAELFQQLALRGLRRPQIGAVRGGSVNHGAYRLWRQWGYPNCF